MESDADFSNQMDNRIDHFEESLKIKIKFRGKHRTSDEYSYNFHQFNNTRSAKNKTFFS